MRTGTIVFALAAALSAGGAAGPTGPAGPSGPGGPGGPPPATIPLPADNPFACHVDAPPRLVTRELPSSLELTIPEYVGLRVGSTGVVEDILFAHDPFPSLEERERASLASWPFSAPTKGGQPVESWATLRLDLRIEFDRPTVTKATVDPVAPDMPLPRAAETRWDSSWFDSARAPSDLRGALAVEALDAPPAPRRTSWSATRFKGPFSVRAWALIDTDGHVVRLVPVEAHDPAMIPYLQRVVGRWTFVPASRAGKFLACWAVLDIEGSASCDITLTGAASIKKTIGRD